MKYTVFISVPTKIEVDALNEEDAKNKVYDNLVATKQIKPAEKRINMEYKKGELI